MKQNKPFLIFTYEQWKYIIENDVGIPHPTMEDIEQYKNGERITKYSIDFIVNPILNSEFKRTDIK